MSEPEKDEKASDWSMDELRLARHASCRAGGAHKFVEAQHVRYTDAAGHEHRLFCEKCGRWA